MVHLRHALKGGLSTVFFGPTSKDLFGYSENIYLTAGICPQGWEWVFATWIYKCSKGAELPTCMEALKTENIISVIRNKKIL